jgi:hypothetical protein
MNDKKQNIGILALFAVPLLVLVIYDRVTAPEKARKQAAVIEERKQKEAKDHAICAFRALHLVKVYNSLKALPKPTDEQVAALQKTRDDLSFVNPSVVTGYDDHGHVSGLQSNYMKIITDDVNALNPELRKAAETLVDLEIKSAKGDEAKAKANDEARAKADAGAVIPPESKITISNSKWTNEGTYDYVRGSVKNGGSQTVSYWKATARFYDKSGSVIDSEFTNSGETLLPGESKRFQIMHRNLPETKRVRVQMDVVRFR